MAGGAGREGALGKQLIRGVEKLDGAAAGGPQDAKTDFAVLSDLGEGGRIEDQSIAGERAVILAAGEIATAKGRRKTVGRESDRVGLRETGRKERQQYGKNKLFHKAPRISSAWDTAARQNASSTSRNIIFLIITAGTLRRPRSTKRDRLRVVLVRLY